MYKLQIVFPDDRLPEYWNIDYNDRIVNQSLYNDISHKLTVYTQTNQYFLIISGCINQLGKQYYLESEEMLNFQLVYQYSLHKNMRIYRMDTKIQMPKIQMKWKLSMKILVPWIYVWTLWRMTGIKYIYKVSVKSHHSITLHY